MDGHMFGGIFFLAIVGLIAMGVLALGVVGGLAYLVYRLVA